MLLNTLRMSHTVVTITGLSLQKTRTNINQTTCFVANDIYTNWNKLHIDSTSTANKDAQMTPAGNASRSAATPYTNSRQS